MRPIFISHWSVTFVVVFLIIGADGKLSADLWINEFHYDNIGTDMDEFVEVVVAPNMAALDLTTVTLTLYNGATGASYDSPHLLSTFTAGAVVNGFSFYSKLIAGIQNDTDGLALSISGSPVPGQFLSYEGSFNATDGPWNGMASTAIGVSETSSTPLGFSLQLTGTGSVYSDFTWTGLAFETMGAANNGQTPVPEPSAFVFGGLICGAIGTILLGRRFVDKLFGRAAATCIP
jgi:hypothetical protein